MQNQASIGQSPLGVKSRVTGPNLLTIAPTAGKLRQYSLTMHNLDLTITADMLDTAVFNAPMLDAGRSMLDNLNSS